jgi:hypothetical protein
MEMGDGEQSMSQILVILAQLVVGLGLLNVWLVRTNRQTVYRGGGAKTMREEFAVYGLPDWFCTLIGFLKISSAVALLLGFWYPALILPSASLITVLMVGAVVMHAKIRDPLLKALPATIMLLMSLVVCSSHVG